MTSQLTISSILNKIIATKREELLITPNFDALYSEYKFNKDKIDSNLKRKNGFIHTIKTSFSPVLIAEIKKASPSKGLIRKDFFPLLIADSYIRGGAALISVLTDEKYFMGSLKYLEQVAYSYSTPCLRKDFIVDKRQILQAKICGASAILLIAACLDDSDILELKSFADELGLDILFEVHNASEMQIALKHDFELIGINNRNLNTFETDIQVTADLIEQFHSEIKNKLIVSESGINFSEQIKQLSSKGTKAFLVGETLMRQNNLEMAVKDLMYS